MIDETLNKQEQKCAEKVAAVQARMQARMIRMNGPNFTRPMGLLTIHGVNGS